MSTKNFTSAQILWASQHDWFVTGNQAEIVGRNEIWNGKHGVNCAVEISNQAFTNFQALRDWAGY